MTLFDIGHYTIQRTNLTSTRSGGGRAHGTTRGNDIITAMKLAAVLIALIPCQVFAHPARSAIADLRVLRETLWSDAAKDARFDVTGFVAFVCDGKTTRIDIVEGESHHQFWFSTAADCPVRSGDLARLRGHLGPPPENIRREITSPLAPYVDRADSLGKAPARHYEEISGVRLICGDFTNASVSVRGVVSGAHRDELNANWNWFILRTQTAKVFVATPDRENSLESLKGLADAEVTVCGSAMPSSRLNGLSRFQLLVVGVKILPQHLIGGLPLVQGIGFGVFACHKIAPFWDKMRWVLLFLEEERRKWHGGIHLGERMPFSCNLPRFGL